MSNAAPTLDEFAMRILHPLIRRERRRMLVDALDGSSVDRMNYCIQRTMARHIVEMGVYGTVSVHTGKDASMAVHWFARLEGMAEKRRGKS